MPRNSTPEDIRLRLLRRRPPENPHLKYVRQIEAGAPIEYHGITVPVTEGHMPLPILIQIAEDAYERPELLAAKGMVQPGDRILEMGTGLGIVSGLISRMADGIEIRSFEANPNLLPHIADLHRLNDITNVDVTHAMLEPNPDTDTRTFHIHKYFSEGSIYQTEMSEDAIEIPVVDMNTLVDDFQPTVLVCDIEGAEEIVIPKANLSTLRALVLEVHPKVMSRAGMKSIFDACLGAGLYPRVELSTEQVVAFERVD
ncbi:MAG: FkbM family methyltransferase [Pseudomonadota bacterium]